MVIVYGQLFIGLIFDRRCIRCMQIVVVVGIVKPFDLLPWSSLEHPQEKILVNFRQSSPSDSNTFFDLSLIKII